MPKISAIIPVYNSERYLEKCLDSILNQTFQDFEIIVVNDGSKDSSQDILDRYCNDYPDKFRCFYQENAGQAAARNKGLKYATGEYIIFIDSDDYIDYKAFEKTHDYAVQNDLDIVNFLWCDIVGESVIKHEWFFKTDSNTVKYMLNHPSPCNKLFKHSLFTENNIRFEENYIYEDLALIPTIGLYTDKIGFIDDVLYYYVIHDNSTMKQKKYSSKLSSIYFAVEYLSKALKNTQYEEELEYLYIEHLLYSAVLRYLDYKEGIKDIHKISDIMNREYPNFKNNSFFKQRSFAFRIFCIFAYNRMILPLKAIKGIRRLLGR